MTSTFAIAGLQLELTRKNNLDEIAEEVRLAKTRLPWLDMVVLSELTVFGASLDDAEPMPGETERRLAQIAREHRIWFVPGSLYETSEGRIYNTAPVINPRGEVIARYRKIYPFMPYERGVAPGDKACVFDVPGVGRFGVSICYDMWFPETTRQMAFEGAEIILHPTLTNTIDRDVEISIARANAAMNQCYFVDINAAGRLGFGRSCVFGPGGELVYQAHTGREIIAVECDLDYVRRVRERGWQNLGQTLKSFRDVKVSYPVYEPGAESEAWKQLGPLDRPARANPPDSGDGALTEIEAARARARKT